MTPEQIARILRGQAWERAKAELQSMLITFYNSQGKFEQLNEAVENFIDHVESFGLHE